MLEMTYLRLGFLGLASLGLFLPMACGDRAAESGTEGTGSGGAGGAGAGDSGGFGGLTDGAGGGGGVGGEAIDPERGEMRDVSFCPTSNIQYNCDGPDFWFVYGTAVGCGMRVIYIGHDTLDQETEFIDLATDETIYRSYLDDFGGCTVYVDETLGAPTCDDFGEEDCGYFD